MGSGSEPRTFSPYSRGGTAVLMSAMQLELARKSLALSRALGFRA
jgi:hypothetical protein